MPASASKKASNTPAWLKRQKRFQIEFQFPNVSGRARQVMLWTEKKWSASRKVRSFRPLPPRRERQARNTSRTVSQSSSVIRVSMVGLLKPTHQEAQIRSAGNQQARLLASIRPHGVVGELSRRNLSFGEIFTILAVPGLISAVALLVKPCDGWGEALSH